MSPRKSSRRMRGPGVARRRLAFLGLSILWLVPAMGCVRLLEGQERGRAAGDVPETDTDSLEVLRGVQEAQREFERLRRDLMPHVGRAYACDERVGQACLSFGLGRTGPRAEALDVRRARDRLIDSLGAAARRLPADEWISGQRIRYLVEVDRTDEALALAEHCRLARRWWCLALEGYVRHVREEFGAARTAFQAALGEMPEERRRWWTDISVFLTGEARRTYLRANPPAGDSLERRLWWLAQPLYLREVNDRWTEHHARNVMVRLASEAQSGFGRWGSDLEEVVLRHGWPIAWARRGFPSGRTTIISYHRDQGSGHRFMPPPEFLLDPTRIGPGAWSMNYPAPRTTYAPTYLSAFGPLEYQVAIFQRGDSAEVVAAFDQTPDPLWRDQEASAGLFLTPDELSPPLRVTQSVDEARGLLRMTVPTRPGLLSFELWARRGRRAARTRWWLPLRTPTALVLSLSDLLIITPRHPLAASLDRAAELARGSLRARAGERLGLYWELYGLGPDTERLSLMVGLYRLGAEGERPPLLLRWREEVGVRRRIWARTLELDLPRDLTPGHYLLQLRVEARGREPVDAVRMLRVEAPDERPSP